MKHRHFRHALALSLLALAVLAVYARVLFTPLIPASGDFLAYFAPYWQQLNEALRAGSHPRAPRVDATSSAPANRFPFFLYLRLSVSICIICVPS